MNISAYHIYQIMYLNFFVGFFLICARKMSSNMFLFFFCHFKADKIKDSILKKALPTCNFLLEVLSTNLMTTEEVTQSSQDVIPTQKANIDFRVQRKRKLPTLDENKKSDQKKNIEPKPKQTKHSSIFLNIN